MENIFETTLLLRMYVVIQSKLNILIFCGCKIFRNKKWQLNRAAKNYIGGSPRFADLLSFFCVKK
jgi:hypothetical protein